MSQACRERVSIIQSITSGACLCHPELVKGSLYKYHLCVIPSAAEGSEQYALKAICSQTSNTDCIWLTREHVQTRSTSRRFHRLSAQGDTMVHPVIPSAAEGSLCEYRQYFNRDPSTAPPYGRLRFSAHIGHSPCNANALRRAFARVRLKRNARLFPCKQAKPSRSFRMTENVALCVARAARGKRVNLRHFYNGVP